MKVDIKKLLPKKKTRGIGWGILFSIIIILIVSALVALILEKLPTNIYTYLLAYTTVVITIPFICFGKRFLSTIEPGFNGVPLFLEGRVDLWLFTEGLIWKLPKPIMGFIPVNVREQNYEMKGTIALSNDTIPIVIDLSISTMVVDPYAYTWIENPEKAMKDLILREVRSFIIGLPAEETPSAKEELRKHLKVAAIDEMQGRDDEGGDKKRPWGMLVTRVFVTDIRLPKDLEDAHTRKKIEEALAIAKLTKVNNLKAGIQVMRVKGLFDKMSDQEITNAIQAEYGTATRIIVDGSDPISRAAAIFTKSKEDKK